MRNIDLEESILISPIFFLGDNLLLDFAMYRALSHISKTAITFISLDFVSFVVLNKDKNRMVVSLKFEMSVVTNYVSG